jgi:hypothetical protein
MKLEGAYQAASLGVVSLLAAKRQPEVVTLRPKLLRNDGGAGRDRTDA